MSVRYALYAAPPSGSALWRYGCEVLGYDAETGADAPAPTLPGVAPDELRALTEDPRRYGFHATIKAPFRLAEGRTVEELRAALRAFCAGRAPLRLPTLEVRAVGANAAGDAFVALVEPEPTPALLALERDAVLGFEPFRAPLTPAEIARRAPERLPPRQRELLFDVGYPGALDEFRFHLTLTGRAPGPRVGALVDALAARRAAQVDDPGMTIDDLALFVQEDGGRFRVAERVPFGARRGDV